jgi:hypothetical protein
MGLYSPEMLMMVLRAPLGSFPAGMEVNEKQSVVTNSKDMKILYFIEIGLVKKIDILSLGGL